LNSRRKEVKIDRQVDMKERRKGARENKRKANP
jgi:hypothetical protein